mmetsp:Transcript_9253/g.17660  ORF Transcript_9253/g.17660 Transcript_9253/m.17660 type:complete len:89 (+) Transcript_9253:3576-3842(+)
MSLVLNFFMDNSNFSPRFSRMNFSMNVALCNMYLVMRMALRLCMMGLLLYFLMGLYSHDMLFLMVVLLYMRRLIFVLCNQQALPKIED